MKRLLSFVQRHPAVDLALPCLAAAIGMRFAPVLLYDPTVDRNPFYAGLSALAGIVMATITFACSMTYGRQNKLMESMRERHSHNISRNFLSMTILSLTSAILPLASMIFPKTAVSMAFALASLVLTVEESLRCVFWIWFTLFIDKVSVEYAEDDYDTEKALRDMSKN
jgi:hypothetical protein